MFKSILPLIICFFEFMVCHSQTKDWSKKSNPMLNSINSVTFSNNGQSVLSGTNCHPASIRIYDMISGQLNWDYTVGPDFMCIMGVSFSANTKYIVAIEEFGNLFVFDNSGVSPVILDTINTGTMYGFATAISPGNDKVAVACSDGKMKIYNLPQGTLYTEVNAHPSWVTCVTYSQDGKYIITGGNDRKVRIWNADGTLRYTCSGHTDDITSVKATPDNKFVVSASRDNKVKVWNLTTGVLSNTIAGHTDDVVALAISPDGTMLVTASSDSTCKIWDIASGKLFTTFDDRDSGAVNAIAWSPLGNKIATGNLKSDLVVWSLPAKLSVISTQKEFQPLLYPNPVKDKLYFDHFPINKDATLYINDQFGRLIKSIEFNTGIAPEFDVHELPVGIYCAVLQIEKQVTSQVFCKN